MRSKRKLKKNSTRMSRRNRRNRSTRSTRNMSPRSEIKKRRSRSMMRSETRSHRQNQRE